VFCDPTQRAATAALALGFAHRKFNYFAPNITPFGAVIAAPLPRTREIPCRDGLKYYARISEKNIRAAFEEVAKKRAALSGARPENLVSKILCMELDLAARMAQESCSIMLWQQALASGKRHVAGQIAKLAIGQLTELQLDFAEYWPLRNKGTTEKCSTFLRWRIEDYRRGTRHFPTEHRGSNATGHG
jgi:hypothetical protein